MTEEEERRIISSLGVGQVFEGIGNIINIVGKVIDEGILSQMEPISRQDRNIQKKKSPESSRN